MRSRIGAIVVSSVLFGSALGMYYLAGESFKRGDQFTGEVAAIVMIFILTIGMVAGRGLIQKIFG